VQIYQLATLEQIIQYDRELQYQRCKFLQRHG
jgi:hypothetical protein